MDIYEEVKKVQRFIANKDSNYRKLLLSVIKNPPHDISIGDWDDKGDIQFSLSMTDIGLQYKDYSIYKNEFFSYFIVDFIGELIVRENLPSFIEKLQEYNYDDYSSIVENHGRHKRFGVRTTKGKLFFEFHVSFLKELLTENLRESLG